MGNEIRPDALSEEIAKTLKEYTGEVKEQVWAIADEVSKETVEQLQITSPKRTGRYAKNWTRAKQADGFLVYQKQPTAYLTHLLEKGWAKKGGGRVKGRPHIEPAEERAMKEFEEKVRRTLEK